MIVSDFIAASYLKATGTVSTLTSTDTDWTKLLALGNLYQQNWAHEPGVDWRSLYNPAISCGSVTATDTFSLTATINKVSQEKADPVRIVWASDTNKYTDYTIVAADELKIYNTGQFCAQIGQTLKFNKTFASTDSQFGGTINVPGYTVPATLAASTDLITVDIPEWLVTICAAEYVRNNLVRQNQYPNLLTEANELMKKMIENNDSQLMTVPLQRVALGRSW